MIEECLLFHQEPLPFADIPIAEMTASQCLDVITDAEGTKAHLEAAKIRALARFAELRPTTNRFMDFADGAREEVAVEIGVSPDTANNRLLQARNLVTRLPATVEALSAGRIDRRRALAMNDLTGVLSEKDARTVENRVLERGGRSHAGKFRDAIRHHVIKIDPASAAKRRAEAEQHRDVTFMPSADGMGHLNATLTAEETVAVHRCVDMLARRAKTPDRLLGDCRADALMSLILGNNTETIAVNITVTVPMTTLMGLTEHPGELVGYGPITAEHARELAQHATLRRVITDEAGHVKEVGRRRHKSTAPADRIRSQDQTCHHPGCNNPTDASTLCTHHDLTRQPVDWVSEQPPPKPQTTTTPKAHKEAITPEPERCEPAPGWCR